MHLQSLGKHDLNQLRCILITTGILRTHSPISKTPANARLSPEKPMRRIALTTALLLVSAFTAPAQKDTLNGVTFDFDAAAPPLTASEQAFAQSYINAVNNRDASALLALRDSSYSTCANDGSEILLRDLQKDKIPVNAKLRFFRMNTDFTKMMGVEGFAYLAAQPTAMFGISTVTKTKDQVKMVTILRSVRETADAITIVPYCLTDKGKSLMHQ